MQHRYKWIFLSGILLALFLNLSLGWIGQYDMGLTRSLVASAQTSPEPPFSFTGTDKLEVERVLGSQVWGTSLTESIFLSGSWQFFGRWPICLYAIS